MSTPLENSGAAHTVRVLAALDGASRTYNGPKSRAPRLPASLNDRTAYNRRGAA